MDNGAGALFPNRAWMKERREQQLNRNSFVYLTQWNEIKQVTKFELVVVTFHVIKYKQLSFKFQTQVQKLFIKSRNETSQSTRVKVNARLW